MRESPAPHQLCHQTVAERESEWLKAEVVGEVEWEPGDPDPCHPAPLDDLSTARPALAHAVADGVLRQLKYGVER